MTPGYMKALTEDGFRTYGQHRNLIFRNCTAKNMRGGFELRSKTGVRLENCTAIGNERGFWVSNDATLINCHGDAQHGPLLFVEGNNAAVELSLAPTPPASMVHALASIQGTGHKVTIKPTDGSSPQLPPIMVGYGTPMMGEGMAPIPERDARALTLRNETTAPIVIGAKASELEVLTHGAVSENKGKNITIKTLE
ncbi:MAG: hypothetical protein EOP84_24440 [Verrucomicrobiaceae bacterium]|nr:MAG: hypothetical protein EOP84_24440 [Verrucomicrobiaceae bacterium]